MMQRYETLLLTVPEITGDEAANLETQLTKIVEKEKGSVLSFERWGKYRLAYPVKKNEYGVYFLYRYETNNPDAITKNVKSLFTIKLNDLVMRDMTSVLDNEATLAYQKPPSLEDMPSRDVGTFLKENKMEGLLPKTAPVKAAVAAEASDDTKEETTSEEPKKEAPEQPAEKAEVPATEKTEEPVAEEAPDKSEDSSEDKTEEGA